MSAILAPHSGTPRARAAEVAVTRLDLTAFRSYAALRLELEPRPVVLFGANGAGKTNLLEAVSFLAPGRGLRRAALAEVTHRDAAGANGWAVAARLIADGMETTLGTGLDPQAAGSDRRVLRRDGVPLRAQAGLAELVTIVWLTPEMDRLFQGGSAARRRFLDRLAFGFDPAHATRVAAYERALAERARLLRAGDSDPAWLAGLETQMAEAGVALAATRREVVARLGRAGRSAPAPFPMVDLAVAGAFEAWLDEGPALAAEEQLVRALADSRARDAPTGGAAHGPHHADVVVRHREKNCPAAQCSTGEQKALLIGLVLGFAQALAAARGHSAILLLDEVAAHLDRARREALFDALSQHAGQVWLTGAIARDFAALSGRAQFIAVAPGTARPEAAV